MPTTTAIFGRRGARAQQPPSPAQPRPARPAQELSTDAEAFRAEIAAGLGSRPDAFGDWRRAKDAERWLMLVVAAFSFAPGLVSFAIHAPPLLSSGLGVAAVVGNFWFRATRRRRMREITAWREPEALP